MIHVQPKTVTASDTLVSYEVHGVFARGSAWSPAALRSLSVRFVNGSRRTVDRALMPAEALPTDAQLSAIRAVTPLAHETAQAWIERASASFVQAAYGLSPAPVSAPAAPDAPAKKT